MLDWLKNNFLPQKKGSVPEVGSNRVIYDELNACFRQGIVRMSFGQQLMYPASFNIFLNPDDYEESEQSFPFLVKGVINSFYAQIRQTPYEDKTATSSYWFFQFSPAEKITLPGKNAEDILIKRGHAVIIGRLFSNRTSPSGNTMESSNVKLSLKPKNSDTYQTVDINIESIRGLDIIGKGSFKVKLNTAFEELKEEPTSGVNVFAEIKYSENGQHKTFSMIDKEIIISKKRDSDNGKTNVLQLDSDAIAVNHARIRVNDNKKFEIAAFSRLKLNERTLPLSSGNDVTWTELNNRARILIGVEGQLPFTLEFLDAGK
jgi:hypothetical protein